MKDNKKYKSMFKKDFLLIAAFVVLTVFFMAFAFIQVLSALDSSVIKTSITAVLCCNVFFLVWFAVLVIRHLKQNRDKVYEEDLYYAELNRKHKEG